MQYSSVGLDLLAAVVEVAAGEPLPALLERRVSALAFSIGCTCRRHVVSIGCSNKSCATRLSRFLALSEWRALPLDAVPLEAVWMVVNKAMTNLRVDASSVARVG